MSDRTEHSLIGSAFADSFGGIRLYANQHLVERRQVRFPRSKKRRIRKKWAKRASNWAVRPDPSVYMVGRDAFGHPAILAKIANIMDTK